MAPVCTDCIEHPLPLDTLRSLWIYSGKAEHAIKAFKYSGERRLIPFFADALVRALTASPLLFDLVVPAPSTLRSLRERGFGHMALVARQVAGRLHKPCMISTLQTLGEREPQASLPPADRIRNMQQQIRSQDVSGRRILLVDDVLTTGATVFESAKALRLAGARNVSAITLARSNQFIRHRRSFPAPSVLSALLLLLCTNACDNGDPEYRARMERQQAVISALKSDVRALRADVELLKNEPRAALSSTPNSPVVPITFKLDADAKDDPYLGDPSAPLLLLGFSDYECKRCNQFARETLPKLRSDYIDSGKVWYVLRDFPLSNHKHAVEAARIANCCGEQGEYWGAHDLLTRSLAEIERGKSLKAAGELEKIDKKKLERCAAGGKYRNEIDLDVAAGKALGVQGAPVFLLGKRLAEKTFQGVMIRGAQPIGVFRREIERLLGPTETSERTSPH